jgi:hydrogenase maturation protein HypF
LFDAFAALCGLRQRIGYEGQAAAEFEWAAEATREDRCYDFPVRDDRGDDCLIVDWQPAVATAIADLRAHAMVGTISAAMHRGLAAAIASVAQRVGVRRVVLSGGCFQNARLTEMAVAALRNAAFDPVWHRCVPPNDGGIALGQAAWAG